MLAAHLPSPKPSIDVAAGPPGTRTFSTHALETGAGFEAFARELDALRAEAIAELGPGDLEELLAFEGAGRLLTALGYLTGWMAPNPLSALCLGLGNSARWTIIMHHASHGAFDRLPGVPDRLRRQRFARGRRRYLDWLDWIEPESWAYEHNRQHHPRLGESLDPDLVEENLRWLRESRLPRALRYLVVAGFALTWKLTYYAPNALVELRAADARKAASPRGRRTAETEDDQDVVRGIAGAIHPGTETGRAFLRECVAPYGLVRFVLAPSLFLPLGPWAAFSVAANTVLAELFANLHTFVVITANHAGADLYRFEGAPRTRAAYYLRQILGSTNYRTGHPVWDFLQGGLNYQIEHHLFPDLPMSAYRRLQPKVQALCERYGVPYTQEPIGKRLWRMLRVAVGQDSMRRPTEASHAIEGNDVGPEAQVSAAG